MKNRFSLTGAVSALAAAVISTVSAATLYVSLDSPNPMPPFASWATAAKVIQNAVDAAAMGDEIVVTNGVYATGGRSVGTNLLVNRVAVDKPLALRSVNGPLVTVIQGVQAPDGTGDGAGRCVFLAGGAILSGFTLTNGATRWESGDECDFSGGGAFCISENDLLTNCVVAGNWAYGWGGGTFGGRLDHCTVTGNSAQNGGGVADCTLYSCTLSGNWAGIRGGGASGGTLHNCTLTGNSAVYGGGAQSAALYSCVVQDNIARNAWRPSATGLGGGVCHGALLNCTLSGNLAGSWGGGAYGSALCNCTVTDNSAGTGGGAHSSALHNSVVYFNTATEGANHYGATLDCCCTTPVPTNGFRNIVGPPLFMDLAGGDFRLREDSPCIDAGTNLVGFSATVINFWDQVAVVACPQDATDLLGNTRFIDGNFDGTVAWDIGAYEFNSFRPPRFALHPQLTPEGWRLDITGAPNKWVHLQRSSNLRDWEDIWSGWMGAEGIQQINDADTGQKAMFYRVVVP